VGVVGRADLDEGELVGVEAFLGAHVGVRVEEVRLVRVRSVQVPILNSAVTSPESLRGGPARIPGDRESPEYHLRWQARSGRMTHPDGAEDADRSGKVGTRMMSSQLGRMILDASGASGDEMKATPDRAGRYSPMDDLLGELAVQIRVESRSRGDRRPEEHTQVE